MTPLDSRIDEDFVCRLYRGEPFVFEGQLEDANGAVEALDGRTFWACIMAADGTRLHEVVAEILADRSGAFYRAAFDGAMTDERFGEAGLIWSQGEFVASGRKIHAQGPLIIYPGPGAAAPEGESAMIAVSGRIIRRVAASGRSMIRLAQQGARGPSLWEAAGITREQYEQERIDGPVLAAVIEADLATARANEATDTLGAMIGEQLPILTALLIPPGATLISADSANVSAHFGVWL